MKSYYLLINFKLLSSKTWLCFFNSLFIADKSRQVSCHLTELCIKKSHTQSFITRWESHSWPLVLLVLGSNEEVHYSCIVLCFYCIASFTDTRQCIRSQNYLGISPRTLSVFAFVQQTKHVIKPRVTVTVLELLNLDLVLYTATARTIIGHFHNITGIVQFKPRVRP